MRAGLVAPLPIDDVLGDVEAAIRAGRDVVVLAPPGAGKTTRVPATVADVVEGRVLVLEPRRLAARLAANRLAEELNTTVGAKVGYQVRFDDRTSKRTRIALITEGILTRRMQSDPTLDDVGAVILDEVHERSIHADLALAFLREVQETVRPDLRIVVMSATLDPAPLQKFLGDATLVESDGRLHPVDVRYLEQKDDRRVPDLVVSGVRRAVRDTEGDVLAFLPGAGEIRRAQTLLEDVALGDVDVLPLYGELDPKTQDRAVGDGPRRKVILATNIAESSLTIPGVRTVVDGGFEKRLRHDPATGLDQLELGRISLRSATQRAGRAGRLGPGVAFRMWTQKEEIAFSEDIEPEIKRIDLSRVLLDVLTWSASDPLAFGWFETPPAAAVERAAGLLRALGALEPDGWKLTAHGKRLAALPLSPRVGTILAAAHEAGALADGATIAALASERDVLRRGDVPDVAGDSDLLLRLDMLPSLRSGDARQVRRVADRLASIGRRTFGDEPKPTGVDRRRLVLAGFPDRVGRRRSGRAYRFVGAGGGKLADESVVKDADLIVATSVDKRRGDSIIRMATSVERAWLSLETVHTAAWNAEREVAEARVETRYLDLVIDERPDPKGDPNALSAALIEAARKDLDRALPLTDDVMRFLFRCAFVARERGLDMPTADTRADLLDTLAFQKKSFNDLKKIDLVEAFRQHMGYELASTLDREAPSNVKIPSGRNAKLEYTADGPPKCSVRLQEVFGLYETPRVAGVPIKMELLAPNMRPVQVTQDLASFWANTYAEVRKDLRARYPKHQWPEDPKDGIASTRVRPRRR